MILALDSSTATAGVALYGPGGIVSEFTWLSHRDHTVQIMPMVQKMMDLEQSNPDQLTGVAVATGPGSFNGLRVAVSAAKGIALSLDLPIYGITSLDLIAAGNAYLSGNLCAVVEAGRGRVGAGFYRVKGGKWKQEGDYLNLNMAELVEKISQPTFIAGELKPEQRTDLAEKLGKQAIILPPAASLRRPGFLAELAWQRQQSGIPGDDLANLQPIYLHQPAAVRS
ncbi:MAG TPA: tRNA (adenosine(37)-N6)-threonylcarbamoyltransferase complex dimerization subunit type 1 TsaB [Chloroflexia bacterium]|nr:tRNA (adenosine(37)-N6)-threonylcarbamoyltransferase complex dimerization subunit type 1 TsaB [Chloroflexia bacterium]